VIHLSAKDKRNRNIRSRYASGATSKIDWQPCAESQLVQTLHRLGLHTIHSSFQLAGFDELGGVAGDDGERGDISGDDGTGGDNGAFADGDAWQEDGACADPDAVANRNGLGNQRAFRARDVMARRADERLARDRDLRANGDLRRRIEIHLIINRDKLAELEIPRRPDSRCRIDRDAHNRLAASRCNGILPNAKTREEPIPPPRADEIRHPMGL